MWETVMKNAPHPWNSPRFRIASSDRILADCRVYCSFTEDKNMRFIACLFVALSISASVICAQDQPKFSPAQQEVLDTFKAMVAAGERRDGSWSRYIADDCLFSDDDGNLTTKAKIIGHGKTWPREYDHVVNFRDYVVHVYGSTAVINVRFTGHEQFTDTDIVTEMRETETYVKQNGSWLMVARQWGPLPVNLRKPVAVDTSVYKDYVGQYQWRPLDDVETISVKDGKLWSQVGKDAEEEYFALGPETFFVKDDLGGFTFVRDAQGHVTGYTYHRWDGQDIHAKKIK